MKIKSYTSAIFITISVLIGFVLASQLIFTRPYLVSNPFEPYQELQDSIRALSQEQETLQERLSLLRDELSNYDELEVSSLLKRNLENLKKEAGLTELPGRGLKVTLDDKFSESTDFNYADNVCYAADLRDIINVMRLAGSDTISINNQRIIYSTPIACVGTSVLINNVRMLPPFQISVLANSTWSLKNYLNTAKFLPSIYERRENEEIVFLVEDKEKVVIPAYKGNLAADYLNLPTDEL